MRTKQDVTYTVSALRISFYALMVSLYEDIKGGWGSGSRLLEFKSHLSYFWVVSSSHVTLLGFRFLILKMGIIIISTTKDC